MNLVFALLVGILSWSPVSFADEHGHNHEAALEPAPHGGILRDAPPYKGELVLNGENVKIYVYDKDLKPANLESTSIEGKLRLPKDKKERSVSFKKKGEAYEAKIAGIAKVHRYDLHVTVKEGATSTNIDFGIDNIH